MRDIVLIAIIAYLSALALMRPWIGVLAWTWLSIMNPHKYAWKAASLPLAFAVAACTILGLVLTRDKRHVYLTPESALLMLFMVWMTITLPMSFDVSASYPMWERVMKIDLMILVTLMVLYTKRHIMAFAIVVVASLGFYGIKGGLFTLAHGGSYLVWGPAGTFIEGNNEIALALIMVIPLMRFLQLQTDRKWLHRALTAAMLLSAAAALGSHSRGALLAICAMAFFFWRRNNRKLLMGLTVFIVGILLIAFMPQEWSERMATIENYEQDGSAMARIQAWGMAFNLAKDNFFGGGFEIYNAGVFAVYAPGARTAAAHSIYFQVLGEHGFVGLLIFLVMWYVVWRNAAKLYKTYKNDPKFAWASQLAAMCQVSMVGYFVGGAFLSLAYFDLPYNIMVLVILARRLAEGRVVDDQARSTAPLVGLVPKQRGAG